LRPIHILTPAKDVAVFSPVTDDALSEAPLELARITLRKILLGHAYQPVERPGLIARKLDEPSSVLLNPHRSRDG
jgi:hypothetical protein